jgi:hypothetical protein
MAHYRTESGAVLPDAVMTPGAARITDATQLCSATTGIPPVPEEIAQKVYWTYGVGPIPGACCRLDLLIPAELGGSVDEGNVWPQPLAPRPAAQEKAALAKYLRQQVCSRKMNLVDVQSAIATNWYALYRRTIGKGRL